MTSFCFFVKMTHIPNTTDVLIERIADTPNKYLTNFDLLLDKNVLISILQAIISVLLIETTKPHYPLLTLSSGSLCCLLVY